MLQIVTTVAAQVNNVFCSASQSLLNYSLNTAESKNVVLQYMILAVLKMQTQNTQILLKSWLKFAIVPSTVKNWMVG